MDEEQDQEYGRDRQNGGSSYSQDPAEKFGARRREPLAKARHGRRGSHCCCMRRESRGRTSVVEEKAVRLEMVVSVLHAFRFKPIVNEEQRHSCLGESREPSLSVATKN